MSDLGYPQILPNSGNYSTVRTRKFQICTHCTATPYSDSYPRNLGLYWQNNNVGTATQYALSDTQVYQYVPHWATAYATRMPGNANAIHVEFIGLATYSRDQWLAHDAMFRRAAKLYVQIAAKETDISLWLLRNLTNYELGLYKPGVFTHKQHTEVFSGTHTDPGPGFPHDVLWGYIKQELAAGGSGMALSSTDLMAIAKAVADYRVHGTWPSQGIANDQVYRYLQPHLSPQGDQIDKSFVVQINRVKEDVEAMKATLNEIKSLLSPPTPEE